MKDQTSPAGSPFRSGRPDDLWDARRPVRHSRCAPVAVTTAVSNDNPHAEATFKTLKYHPNWPKKFETLDEVTAHCEQFFGWSNDEHHHSGVGMLTPTDHHAGHGQRIDTVAQTGCPRRRLPGPPERFPNGRPHPPHQPTRVWINPTELHTR